MSPIDSEERHQTLNTALSETLAALNQAIAAYPKELDGPFVPEHQLIARLRVRLLNLTLDTEKLHNRLMQKYGG